MTDGWSRNQAITVGDQKDDQEKDILLHTEPSSKRTK